MRDFGFALVYPLACLVALVFAPLLVETYDQMLVWQPARAHITEPVILAFGVHMCSDFFGYSAVVRQGLETNKGLARQNLNNHAKQKLLEAIQDHSGDIRKFT